MMRLATLALFCVCLGGPVTARAAPPSEPSARDQHAAQCVAALDAHTQALARQVKAGKESVRPLLLDRLIAGAAFVGDAYLHGDSDEPQARELAEQAREAQQKLPPGELLARQNACASEGARLYSAGNPLQKAVVKRVAKRRMEKLLAG